MWPPSFVKFMVWKGNRKTYQRKWTHLKGMKICNKKTNFCFNEMLTFPEKTTPCGEKSQIFAKNTTSSRRSSIRYIWVGEMHFWPNNMEASNIVCSFLQLIQFLVTLVGNHGLGPTGGVKRKMPLMINDSSQLEAGPRPTKIARPYTNTANTASIQVIPVSENDWIPITAPR